MRVLTQCICPQLHTGAALGNCSSQGSTGVFLLGHQRFASCSPGTTGSQEGRSQTWWVSGRELQTCSGGSGM